MPLKRIDDLYRRFRQLIHEGAKFLVVGANNDDEAKALAEHIRQEAPPGAQVCAEPAGVRLPFIAF